MKEGIFISIFYAGFVGTREGWNGEYAGDGHDPDYEELKEKINELKEVNPEVVELARCLYRDYVAQGAFNEELG